MGYNVICSPVLDLVKDWRFTSANISSLGGDKFQVTKLAAAEDKGLHDGGVLTIAKHYPGGAIKLNVDSHMVESFSETTKEELLEYYLLHI